MHFMRINRYTQIVFELDEISLLPGCFFHIIDCLILAIYIPVLRQNRFIWLHAEYISGQILNNDLIYYTMNFSNREDIVYDLENLRK
jgi:hypothetical protein